MVDFSALFKKKEDPKEYYFGLFLRGDSAVGFLFEIKNGVVSQIAKENCKYSNGWEGILDDIDELLSVLENETKIHIDQCIFFVYSYFIDQETGDIKEPYKDVIKSISKELELKPMGYIECHEAVKDMIEKKDASALNGVLVELDHNHLSYYVYKGGKMIHTDQTPRTDAVVDDLAELFSKNKDHFLLPSKVILYGSSSLDKESQEIKAHTWEKDLFIQSPRVQVVKNEEVLGGLSTTFMEQIEKDMGGEAVVEEAAPVPAQREIESEEVVEERVVAPKKASAVAEVEDDGIPDEAENVGFVVGADITEEPEVAQGNTGVHMDMSSFKDKFKMPKMSMPSLPSFSFGSGNGPKIALGVAALVLVLGAGAGVEYAFHSAQVEIAMPSDKISSEFDLQAPLTATGEGTFNVEKKTITKEQKESVATSGEREVGEKAKGTVVLNNGEDKSVSYSAGTKLTVDSLAFTLDSDVTIGPAKTTKKGVQTITESETKEASVTAEKIGPEYNIASDKTLIVAGAPSKNIAVAKSTFSGGTKKKLRTVAKKDQDILQKKVLDAEKASTLDEIKGHLSKGENVIPDLTEVKISKADYSGEVGQEANEVSINADVTVDYYVFSDSNLKNEISTRLQKDVPNGFQIDKNKLAYKVANTEKEEGDVNVNVLGEATVVKTVDKNKVIAKITGKSVEEARKILREEFDAEDLTIKANSSPIFFMTSHLPLSEKKIDVRLKSE